MESFYNSTTNIYSVDNYSEIHYRVYEAVLDQHTGKASGQSPGLTPSPSARGQSPASVNAIDIATLGLRTAGCLVSADSSRRVLWAFSNSSRFDVLARAVSAVIDVDDEKIAIHGVTLQRILSGHSSSQELTRPDPSFDTPKISTDRSGTRNSNSGIASADFNRTLNAKAVFQNGNQTTTSTPETQFSESHHQSPSEEGAYDQVIHKNLIDAIASSISLRLCQQKRFIPLNARDLILVNPAVRDTPDDEKSDVRGYGSCKPSLLSLEVGLHRSGSLLLSYSLSSQPWLGILPTTMRSEANPASSQRNLNLWLAPSGCVARLLTAETAVGSTPSSKQVSPIKMHGFESQKDSENRLRIWKSRTLRWLETHGLNTTTMLDDIWIEVEIPVPGPVHSGTSKIFWPSSLCIFREISRPEDLQTELLIWFSPTNGYGDFLGFAEEWLASAGSRQEKLNKTAAEKAAQKATDARHERVQRNHDHTDSLEGFARTPSYLELPPGNTIYPTPPDGIHPQRLQPVSFADGAAETPAEAEEPPINKSDNPMGSVNGDTSMDMLDDSNILMSRNNSTMATGLYDASDNEDLFGEMDGDHFEAKGLTEADFSFFDEPSLENLDSNDIDMEDDDQVAGHGSVVGKDTNQDADNVQTSSEQLSAAVDANTKADGSIVIKDHTVGDVTLEHPSEETMAAPADPASTEPTVDAHKPDKLPVSPPLSPFEVRKKMFSQNMPPPWSGGRKEFDPKRKQSVFEAVDFGESLDLSDKKYAEDGRFSVPNGTIPPTEASRERTPLVSTTIPTIGRLKRKKNGPLNLKIEPTPSTPAVLDQVAGVDRFNFADVLQAVSSEEKESDSSPTDSEQGPAQKLLQGTKRKRRTSDAVADPPSARPDVSTSPADADLADLADLEEDMETLYYLSPSVAEGSFDGYFSMRDNPNLGVLPVSSESFPQLSQVLLEQFSQTTLKHRLDGAIENLALDERGILQDYSEAIQYAFAEASHCDFPTYVKLGDGVSIKREEYSNAGVTDDKLEGLKADVVKLPPQPVRLRRAKNSMEILPSVLPFWETFGLGPHGGPKDVVGLCIHPPTVNAREGANTFLDRLSDAYHSCNLGTHTRTDVSEDHKKSLIPWTLDEPMDVSLAAVMEALKTTCETLGTALAKKPPKNLNFVIYIINPFTQGSVTADICAAFLALFHKYRHGIDAEQEAPNELVLQIVPLSFLASSESLVVPAQSDYIKLALEVYDRCPPKPNGVEKESSLIQYGPATVLAKPVPKTIDFQRTADATPSLLKEGSSLHLAYAQSLDSRWITAAWTDTTGSFQTTLSYCLQQKGSSASRPLAEILEDIWEATCEIMQADQIEWHLMLVKEGVMTLEEVETWTTLSSQTDQSKRPSFTLTLLTANTNPPVILFAPPSPLPSLLTSQPTASFTTPVTTPQPTMYSPEAGQPATPAAAPTPNDAAFEVDHDAVLADASDETWGVLLSHCLNNSYSLVDLRPALGSGYLVKWKGAIEQDGYALLGVNVIWVEKNEKGLVEQVLRDVLRDFRGLSILTKAKGMVAGGRPEEGVLPWHVATVVKGVRALSYVL